MIWNKAEYVVGKGSHVQYYHARQLKLLCRKYRTITQPRAKKKTKTKTKREEKLSTWS